MRNIFKDVANQVIQQLTPEDMKEIMDSTVETVMLQMGPEERLEFAKDVVNNSLTHILSGFSDEQRVELLQTLLPTILREMRMDQLSTDQLLTAIEQSQSEE